MPFGILYDHLPLGTERLKEWCADAGIVCKATASDQVLRIAVPTPSKAFRRSADTKIQFLIVSFVADNKLIPA
jgi:hypothetical protein